MKKALEDIFRLADERTRYRASINKHPDMLLETIREIARKALIEATR